jgi:hypothetical protein
MPPAVSRIGLILAVVLAASAAAEHDDDRQAGRASQASDTAGARIIDYHSARLLLWGTLYAQGGETLYCGQQFGASKGKNINIEHVFPMSWVAWQGQITKSVDRTMINDQMRSLMESRTGHDAVVTGTFVDYS